MILIFDFCYSLFHIFIFSMFVFLFHLAFFSHLWFLHITQEDLVYHSIWIRFFLLCYPRFWVSQIISLQLIICSACIYCEINFILMLYSFFSRCPKVVGGYNHSGYQIVLLPFLCHGYLYFSYYFCDPYKIYLDFSFATIIITQVKQLINQNRKSFLAFTALCYFSSYYFCSGNFVTILYLIHYFYHLFHFYCLHSWFFSISYLGRLGSFLFFFFCFFSSQLQFLPWTPYLIINVSWICFLKIMVELPHYWSFFDL